MSNERLFVTAQLHRTIRIGTLGMDQRQCNTLGLLFQSKCLNRYRLTEDGVAEIYLLDLDVFGGGRLWNEFRERHPHAPLVLLSLTPRDTADPHTLFVQKPIVCTNLIEAIEKHRDHLDGCGEPALCDPPGIESLLGTTECEPADLPPRIPGKSPLPRTPSPTRRAAALMSSVTDQTFVGTSPDIDPTDKEQLSKIYYDPSLYLQGAFQKALNEAERLKKSVTLEGPWPKIHIFLDQGMVSVCAREKQLRPYCTLPNATHKIRLHPLDGGADPHAPPEAYRCSIKTFLWQLSLWASRGRLPDGTDITQPVYLRHWPNFTRMTITPHAMAITALWANEPHTLIETARTLKIPQRYVFAFYSAASTLQLIETDATKRTHAAIPQQTLKRPKHRATLGRLLGYLKGQISRPTPSSDSR